MQKVGSKKIITRFLRETCFFIVPPNTSIFDVGKMFVGCLAWIKRNSALFNLFAIFIGQGYYTFRMRFTSGLRLSSVLISFFYVDLTGILVYCHHLRSEI